MTNIQVLINSLSEDSFMAGKVLFGCMIEEIAKAEWNPALGRVVTILFDEKRIADITRDEFSALLEVVFEKELSKKAVVYDYMQDLYSKISDGRPEKVKAAELGNGQVAKYLAYINSMKEAYRKQPAPTFDAEFADLTDYTKIVLVLDHAYEAIENKGVPDTLNFDLQVSWVNDLAASLLDIRFADDRKYLGQVFATVAKEIAIGGFVGVLPPILGIPLGAKAVANALGKMKKVPKPSEEKWFHVFLLWVLYFRICDEDSVLNGEK